MPHLRPATADLRPDARRTPSRASSGEIPSELRQTSGLGSAGFSGTGWEKRGSRRGIAGSGTEAGEGRVFGRSSASGAQGRSFAEYRAATGTGRAAGSIGGASRALGSGRAASARGRTRTRARRRRAQATFAAGDAVDHKTFGRGTVVKVDGDTLHVKFAKTGQTKKLLKDYAPIVKIG